MKNLLFITFILFTSCQTERINRQLRLSKRHLNRAIELGANIDSVKVQKTSTGNVTGITDKDSTSANVNTDKVTSLCDSLIEASKKPKDVTLHEFDESFDLQNDNKSTITGSLIITAAKKKAIKDLQKHLCPNDSVNNVVNFQITVGKNKYTIPVYIMAYSKAGKAGYDVSIKNTKFEYVTEEVTANIQPGNCTEWWKIALYMLACLIVGIVIGKVMKF